MNEDIIIKDEGEFFTVSFQTLKAKMVVLNHFPKDWIYGDDALKLDLVIESKPEFLKLIEAKNLTVFEF